MNDQIKQIAERLRGLRDVLELTSEDIARDCDISAEEYRLAETGQYDISVSMLQKIARTYNIALDALMFGEEPKMNSYFVTRAGKGVSIERTRAYKYQSLASGFMNRTADPAAHADDQRRDLHGLRHVLMPEYDDQDTQHDRRRAQYDSPRPVALAVADVAQQDLLLGGEIIVARLGFKYEFHLLSPVIVLIFAQIYSTVLPVLASMNARKSTLSPTTKRSSGRI